MSVVYVNPGLIEKRAISTMGVNVKEGDTPIGHFGTGVKYGIATLLRLGCYVVLYIGLETIRFRTKKVIIRGKEFHIVMMDEQELGFTTELGKDWEAWMAYRELYCNTIDEGGVITDLPEGSVYTPQAGHTAWIVTGQPIDEAHDIRETFLIPQSRKPRFIVPNVMEVYDGGSEHLFYRGIRAGKIPYGSRSLYTYNVTRKVKLTEDRTIDYPYEALNMLRDAVVTCNDGAFLTKVLTSRESEEFESHVAYEQTGHEPSETFVSILEALKNERVTDVQNSALHLLAKHTSKKVAPQGRAPTDQELVTIARAKVFLHNLDLGVDDYEIRVADHLGRGTLAVAMMKEHIIILSTEILKDGVRHVAQALAEEGMHLRTGYSDRTRQLQTHLFKQIIRLGEIITGEKLTEAGYEEPPDPEATATDDTIPF